MRKPLDLLLYSKKDCPLCDEMAAAAAGAARYLSISVTYVDITSDPRLQAEYGLDIPLIFHNGACIAKHRITAEELVAKLKRRLGER